MKIGLQLPTFDFPGGAALFGKHLTNIAQSADDNRFASLWVLDHFFQMGRAEDPMLEAYTTLGYLAAVTRQIRLGVLVTGVIYRHPGILAKTVTTLDVLSGGRAYLGIGAAWYEREAKGLGVPFPSTSMRFEQLEETLHIVRQMWDAEDNGAYNGSHYQLAETLNIPAPISQPRPPIIVGGMGEQKTLRLVAQYADGCNLDGSAGIDTLRHKLDVLRGHCEAVGRDYDSLEKTVISHAPDPMNTNAVLAYCRELAALGFNHAIFNTPNVHDLTQLAAWGQYVIPQAAEL